MMTILPPPVLMMMMCLLLAVSHACIAYSSHAHRLLSQLCYYKLSNNALLISIYGENMSGFN